MRSVNLPSGAERNVNAGHVWEEIITNGAGTINLHAQQTFRVRAVAATTVTIGGKLAMTMGVDEIEYFNAGWGAAGDKNSKVEVVITGTTFVQVSSVLDKGRRSQ